MANIIPNNDISKKNLSKKAQKKYLSYGIALLLESTKSPLKKSYTNTKFCNNMLYEHEGKLIGHYCKNRWCLVCNGIKIAHLINSYKPELSKLKNPYFVTLTCKTIPKEELKERISGMTDEFVKIKELSRQLKMKLIGLRKLECTARPNDLYHPHFHLIIEGKKEAEFVVEQWLKRWKGYADIKAQDMRKADKDSLLELFKYFTKLITKKDTNLFNQKAKRTIVHADKLDIIFQAMQGRRVYQPFGIKKKIDEDNTNEIAVIKAGYDGQVFKWIDSDWIDTKTGEGLTGWIPNNDIKNLLKNENKHTH